MLRIISTMVVMIGILLLPATVCMAQNTTVETELKKLEEEMLTAHVMLDFASLDRIYADDYSYISNDGTLLDKNKVIEMVKFAAIRVDSIPESNSRIRVYGNAAIITGIRTFYRAGKVIDEARYTDVWMKRNRRWQCVSGQLTPILTKE